MTEPDPDFDAVHPSGQILVRSCRGGYLHSVALGAAAMDAHAHDLAEAIRLTADVSHLKAVLGVRAEIVAAGHTPSSGLATEGDLRTATEVLARHRLHEA